MADMNSTTILSTIADAIQPFYSKIIITLIILLLGFILGKILSRVVLKLLSEIELNKILKNATGFSIKLDKILSSLLAYFIYFIFIMWALENLGLSAIIINILAGAIIVLIVIALFLAVKDFVPNIFAGLYLQIKQMIKEDDEIEIDSVRGKVIQIALTETKLRSNGKDIIYVPNSAIIRSQKIRIYKKETASKKRE